MNMVIFDIWRIASIILIGILAVGLLLKGPVRWVKIGALVLIILFALETGFTEGFPGVLVFFLLVAVVPLIPVLIFTLTWKVPIGKNLFKSSIEDCPKYALKQVEGLTKEFTENGYFHSSDQLFKWFAMNQERNTWIRFFLHESKKNWAEIHVLPKPKSVSKSITGLVGEKQVYTVDTVSDKEILRDSAFRVNRVPRKYSVKSMCDSHAEAVNNQAIQIENPEEIYVSEYEKWVANIIANKSVIKKEDCIGIPLKSVPGVIGKFLYTWLQ